MLEDPDSTTVIPFFVNRTAGRGVGLTKGRNAILKDVVNHIPLAQHLGPLLRCYPLGDMRHGSQEGGRGEKKTAVLQFDEGTMRAHTWRFAEFRGVGSTFDPRMRDFVAHRAMYRPGFHGTSFYHLHSVLHHGELLESRVRRKGDRPYVNANGEVCPGVCLYDEEHRQKALEYAP